MRPASRTLLVVSIKKNSLWVLHQGFVYEESAIGKNLMTMEHKDMIIHRSVIRAVNGRPLL